MNCTEIQDRLPERAAGRLPADETAEVDRHLETCAECRAVFEPVRLLAATVPAVPEGLENRILAALRADAAGSTGDRSSIGLPAGDPAPARPAPGTEGGSGGPARAPHRRFVWSPAWAWAAAAVLALAVGLPILSGPDSSEPDAVGALALADEGVGAVWLGDDLMVAGAPAVSELSDEVLLALLEEFER